MTIYKDMQSAYKEIERLRDQVEQDPYRMHFHLMPPVGLLNDPNGFVFFKGQYHVFYQWNPFATQHGAKYWGHYVSNDLVHWETAPIALAPDKWYDKNGCYSGSAVVENDMMYLYYTGNVKDEQGQRESYQCLAVSEDGITFEKKGPVIHLPEGYTAHFRDPKVFKKDGVWYMVIGAQTLEEKGEIVLYTSQDLTDWSFQGTLAGSGKNGLGDFGYMWECPDLFELDGTDIVVMSPQGLEPEGFLYQNVFQAGYLAGKMNYENLTYSHGDFTEMDRGFDFYAPQTAVDGQDRRLLFGWMGNAEDGESDHPTTNYHWVHTLTLPRVLEWKNDQLIQKPVPELKELRKNEVVHRDTELSGSGHQFEGVAGSVFELEIAVKAFEAERLTIEIGSGSRLIVDRAEKVFTFERSSTSGSGKTESRSCVIDEVNHIQLFKDTSSIEIFLNDGSEVFSSRVFDDLEEEQITFSADGRVKLDVVKWDLERVVK